MDKELKDKIGEEVIRRLGKRPEGSDEFVPALQQDYDILANIFRNACTWMAEQLQAQGDGWVSVETALPKKSKEEYIVFGRGVVSTLDFVKGKWWSDVMNRFVDEDAVTHWRELPPPPEQLKQQP